MASLSNDPGGKRRILFKAKDGSRKPIRLGKVSKQQATAVKVRIERLVAASITGHAIDDETARWLTEIDVTLRKKLADVGLIERVVTPRLEPFLESYLICRSDVKPATQTNWGHAKRNLIEYFGADRDIATITPGDAMQWQIWLKGQKLSENTIAKRISNAKQFFGFAIKSRLLRENPFQDIHASQTANRERYHYITREDSVRILEACPNAEWRTIFALARWGGLRCPSEVVALRWEHVLWDSNRLIVPSPKTEHHAGKAQRIIPLFNEIREQLDTLDSLTPEGTEFVIASYQGRSESVFRRAFEKILLRAGIQPWPKLFQNLRSTRATELTDNLPTHQVRSWLGHTEEVAQKHYMQIRETDFAKAIQQSSAAQKAAQSSLDVTRQGEPSKGLDLRPKRKSPENVSPCLPTSFVDLTHQSQLMGDIGLEPTTSAV